MLVSPLIQTKDIVLLKEESQSLLTHGLEYRCWLFAHQSHYSRKLHDNVALGFLHLASLVLILLNYSSIFVNRFHNLLSINI